MMESSQASGYARVLESAVLSGNFVVTDYGVAKGTALGMGTAM